ncbi:MAG: Ig-like domain-containing protein [Gemmatimonadetes bacterium]|nr:Ig-like domain-containing protein [Gemmatimonadota bacterium]
MTGDTLRLTAEATDANGHAVAGVEFTWESSDTLVATVDGSGLVSGTGAGEVEIAATAEGVAGAAQLAVAAPVPTTVAVAPDTVAFAALGDTARLTAEVRDQIGRVLAGATVSWSSSDTTVATVDESGLATAAGVGTATITAAAGSASDTAIITVTLSVGVVVRPSADTIAPGDTVRLAAELFDENGRRVSGAAFSWSTSDMSVAGVDGVGLVRGVGEGAATITATAGEAFGISEITVEYPDRAALMALYEATDGPNWARNDNWLTDAPLEDWYGVRTDGSGRVVDLRLGDNELTGRIPVELGDLVNLRTLDLERNALDGPIPSEFATLAQLRTLHLKDNALEGPIPAELGSLVNLYRLQLSTNYLTGPIPAELGNLENLNWLLLNYNNLDGPIPSELGDLVNLRTLILYGNELEGPVPSELGSLVSLTDFRLHSNNLTGPIPQSFLQLDKLVRFSIARNDGLCVPGISAFVAWLEGIGFGDGSDALCNESDWKALELLFERAGGSGWTNADGWVGGPALKEWHGVRADSLGRVTALDLERNGLSGRLAASLGTLARMTELRIGGNTALSGPLPQSLATLPLRALHYEGTGVCAPSQAGFREWLNAIPSHEGTGVACAPLSDREILELAYETLGGPGWYKNDNWLTDAPLGDWYGVEVNDQGRVTGLSLTYNRLSGVIPPELGSLKHLVRLNLGGSRFLAGPIPAELGDLAELRDLILWGSLEGAIPAELGRLHNLTRLDLSNNQLAGTVPSELGDLAKLRGLFLGGNELAGPIPAELGSLSNLEVLALARNGLVGSLPPEFGGLTSLQELFLSGNAEMSGALPAELTALTSLEMFAAYGTGLCAPSDAGFLDWLDRLLNGRIPLCGGRRTMAYLVQTVQSREFPVPLVAGEEALLRTFVTATRENREPQPRVRASFHVDGALVHTAEIPAGAGPIPTVVEQGSLAASANAAIPAAAIRPGLEMVVEIDPDGTLDPGLGVARRIPETGRLPVDVREMPVLDLTVIPFLWSVDPDSAILGQTAGMAADPHGHELLYETRTLLPVGALEVTAHAPVLSSSNNPRDLLRETGVIRALEAGGGHWMGMMSGRFRGGVAFRPGRVSAAGPNSGTISHELGHSMSLWHAPCGGPGGVDPAFPYPDGSSGVWGYDFEGGGLVHPSRPDVMSYCGPHWVSDYHFTKALRFRLADEGSGGDAIVAEPAASLMLWGGVLEPAFAVDAPPLLPDSAGDHRIVGTATDGETLFSISFAMPVLADGDGESSFVFVVPARPAWQAALAAVTLTGPGGTVALDGDSDRAMAILRDPRTGQVRAILRDLPPQYRLAADAKAGVAEPGLDMLFSRGMPDAAAWRR